jgi:hypothetical protein
MDEADAAQHNVDMFLTASLLKHQQRLNQVGDVEAETCNGCSYATKASWGRKCDGWRDCRDDLERGSKGRI